jgi:hypothetical protein
MKDKLIKIQKELSVPKHQFNKFGNYTYRSCEDILEAVKPLLEKEGLLMTITDEVVNIGNRNYVKATVELTDGEAVRGFTAYAREEETKKGMDGSQITGASSSYARKYALNGLFLIDDTKDSDSTNTHDKAQTPNKHQNTTTSEQRDSDVPPCPRCGGEMWDNRLNKKNPKAPDFKCKNDKCLDDKGYVTAMWLPKEEVEEIDLDELPFEG